MGEMVKDTDTLLVILKITSIIAAVLLGIFVIRRSTRGHKFGYLSAVLWVASCVWLGDKDKFGLFWDNHHLLLWFYSFLLPILIMVYCIIGLIEGFIRFFNSKFTFHDLVISKLNLKIGSKHKEILYQTYEDYKIFEENADEFHEEGNKQNVGGLFVLILKIVIGAWIGKMISPDSWKGAYACAGIAVGLEFFDKIVPFVVIGNSSFAIGYWVLKFMISMMIGALLIPVMLLWYISGLLGGAASKVTFNFGIKNRKKKYQNAAKAIGRYPGQLDMYRIFPILWNNEDYEILYNQCRNNDELSEFTHDWKDYFLDLQSAVYLNPQLNPDDLFYTFDEWYQDHQRWRCTSYHHLYYKQQERKYYSKDEKDKNDKSGKTSKNEETGDEIRIYHFVGVNNMESLKKRYHELLKIYHPDIQNGDTTMAQEIQTEYQYLLGKFT